MLMSRFWHFQVTGMSCAACSARVEAAVRRVEGARRVQVNLLTRTMAVEAEESLTPETIVAAVTAAGYGAALATGEVSANTSREDEARAVRRRFLCSLAFLLPLVAVSVLVFLKPLLSA